MPEEQQPESNAPAPLKGGAPRRRGHRGGRGRSRSPRPPAKQITAPVKESAAAAPEQIEVQTARPVAPPRSAPAFTPAAASAIAQAVDEIRQIAESLEQALEQMEEVLKLVETAERQKIADERELESLRRALRKFQSSRKSEPPPTDSLA